MIRRAVPLVSAVSAVLALLAGACSTERDLPGGDAAAPSPSTSTTVVAPPVAQADADVDWATVDVPAASLVPPVAANANVRLTQEAARQFNFCQGWANRLNAKEAAPYDVDELTAWSYSYYTLVHLIDPNGPIPNKSPKPGAPDNVDLPGEVKGAIAAVEKEVYAFYARVMYAKTLLSAKSITAEHVRKRVDYAHVHLGSATFTDAHGLLERFYAEKC